MAGEGGLGRGRERERDRLIFTADQPFRRSLYSLSGLCLEGPGSRHSQETHGPYCLQSEPTENRQTNKCRDVSGTDVEGSGKLPWTARAWGTHVQNLEEPGASTGSGPH